MPLIILSGYPCSGKSTRAKELEQYFCGRGKNVKIISENEAIAKAGFQCNEFYADSQKEKQIRSDIKSETIRQLNKNDIVILDGGNYIKGYRYELYCASKASRTTQCTIFCCCNRDKAWTFNETRRNSIEINDNDSKSDDLLSSVYSREIFDALILRYEEPQANNRWDAPLFTVFPEMDLKLDQIYSVLCENKPPPPNQSTQNPPLSGANYLFELDKLTQEIVATVISARKIGILGTVQINESLHVNVPSDMNASQLNRLRRQFLNYNKLHTAGGNNLNSAPQLFVQFLNSNFNN